MWIFPLKMSSVDLGIFGYLKTKKNINVWKFLIKLIKDLFILTSLQGDWNAWRHEIIKRLQKVLVVSDVRTEQKLYCLSIIYLKILVTFQFCFCIFENFCIFYLDMSFMGRSKLMLDILKELLHIQYWCKFKFSENAFVHYKNSPSLSNILQKKIKKEMQQRFMQKLTFFSVTLLHDSFKQEKLYLAEKIS